MRHSRKSTAAVFVAIASALLLLSGCAGTSAFGDSINRAFNGMPATMTTYTQQGDLVDTVHGASFRISRDEKFDTTNSDGTSKKDSNVLKISLGNSHISHVGSTLVLAEDGLTEVAGGTTALNFSNDQPGTPWLNDLLESHRNLWAGKSKTIMIRSQDGTPIAVYAGDNVEIFATDVPKSTLFRIDGKYLLVYRADLTTYDNDLL